MYKAKQTKIQNLTISIRGESISKHFSILQVVNQPVRYNVVKRRSEFRLHIANWKDRQAGGQTERQRQGLRGGASKKLDVQNMLGLSFAKLMSNLAKQGWVCI